MSSLFFYIFLDLYREFRKITLMNDFIHLFPVLTVLAPIFLFFGQIKELLHKLYNLFVLETEAVNDAGEAVGFYILKNGKFLFNPNKCYSGHTYFVNKEGRNLTLGWEEINKKSKLLKIDNKYFLIKFNELKGDERPYRDFSISLSCFRGKFNQEKFIIKCLDFYNQHLKDNNSRFKIEILNGIGNKNIINAKDEFNHPSKSYNGDYLSKKILKYQYEDIGTGTKNKKFTYIFSEESQKLYDDVKIWHQSKDWYLEHGIFWRRGALLYGETGTGKTAAIRKIAQDLDIPIYLFDIASMSNQEFAEHWQNLQKNTPCFAVIEDIDAVFNGRTNVIGENGGGLSFDCLLNNIGGQIENNGIYIFISTNNIEKVDSALGTPDINGNSSRPGRLDNVIYFDKLNKNSRMKIAEQIFKETNIDLQEIIDYGEGMTGAQFSDFCMKYALQAYWSN